MRLFVRHLKLVTFIAAAFAVAWPLSVTATTDSTVSQLIWDEGDGTQAVQNLESKSGLRIAWWNLEAGQVNKTSLNANIQTLVGASLSPDLIAFGEYTRETLSPATLARLAKIYPYSEFREYSPSFPDEGLVFFSKINFSLEDWGPLDWTPPSLTGQDLANYKNQWLGGGPDWLSRPMIALKIADARGSRTFIPIHLIDPWRRFKDTKGRLATFGQIVDGQNNPLWFQLNRFVGKLKEKFGDNMKSSPLFVFGDFNTPQNLVLKTRGYKLLTQNLTDVVAGDPFTFPARSAAERKTFPPVEIDHGFTNGLQQVDAAEVLRLQGSDHYLLYFILRP